MKNPTTYRDWMVNGMCAEHAARWDDWDTSDHHLSWRMCALIRWHCRKGNGCAGHKIVIGYCTITDNEE